MEGNFKEQCEIPERGGAVRVFHFKVWRSKTFVGHTVIIRKRTGGPRHQELLRAQVLDSRLVGTWGELGES